MYQKIINPINNKVYNINTNSGKQLLKQYVNYYVSLNGGSKQINMEKLNENEKYIEEQLGIIGKLRNQNNSENRDYNTIYKEVKEKIVYKKNIWIIY